MTAYRPPVRYVPTVHPVHGTDVRDDFQVVRESKPIGRVFLAGDDKWHYETGQIVMSRAGFASQREAGRALSRLKAV